MVTCFVDTMSSGARQLLAIVSSLIFCLGAACSPSSENGSGGGGGVGGEGGFAGGGGAGGAEPALTAGLWEGDYRGLRVCFFVRDDGLALVASPQCNLEGTSSTGSSYDLEVEAIGRDENGAPCSFTLNATFPVSIDPDTGAFQASFTEPESGAELAFSGRLTGLDASGVATRSEGSSSCTAGWAASSAAEPVTGACDELFSCCRAILVSPVFFESCNGVVNQGNEARCLEVLLGYPRCLELDL